MNLVCIQKDLSLSTISLQNSYSKVLDLSDAAFGLGPTPEICTVKSKFSAVTHEGHL